MLCVISGNFRKCIFFGFLLFLASIQHASALDALPYSVRTHPYNGWSTPVQGDIRTVGMAGATMGLADTFIASLDNPAGLAITLNGADANFVNNRIYDGNIQDIAYATNAYDFGAAVNSYPWGFSIGYFANTHEGQPYSLSTVPNDTANLSVTTNEIHLSFARIFFKNRLSLGMGFIFGQAVDQMTFGNSTQFNATNQTYALSGIAGASFRLDNRIVLGLAYRLPMNYSVNSNAASTPGLPGFFQSVEVPGRLGLGAGWIPNRFFRMDLSFFLIQSIPNAALLKDDSTPIGQGTTVEPHLGFAYRILDFKELNSTLFWGSFCESSRIQNVSDRIHGTIGVELKPWIFNLGWGFDFAPNYQNYLVSIGLDVIKFLQKLDVVPVFPSAPHEGLLPNPLIGSPEGLPGTLIEDGKPSQPGVDPVKVGLNIPNKLENIPQNLKKAAKEFGQDMVNTGKDMVNAVNGIKPSGKGQKKKSTSKPGNQRAHKKAHKSKPTSSKTQYDNENL